MNQNPDLDLFVDISAFRNHKTGRSCIGYAVVTQHEMVKAGHLSEEAAELITLTDAVSLLLQINKLCILA